MHDVHRDSLIYKKKKKKKKNQSGNQSDGHGHESRSHDHDDQHDHGHEEHSNDHDDHHDHGHEAHSHDHDDHCDHGHEEHSHDHDEEEYDAHDADLHTHKHHDHEVFGDRDMGNRAFAHAHDHVHTFYHKHHHNHDLEHTSLVHKVFNDPVRDWFGAALMSLFIAAGYYRWLPGNLSDGMLVCAAIIGIFPVIKNSLLECINRRRISIELFLGILLLVGLFTGWFLEVAIAALLMLVGSFMRINFSWRNE